MNKMNHSMRALRGCLCQKFFCSARPSSQSFESRRTFVTSWPLLTTNSKKNHYETLKVDVNASPEQIRNSFLKLSKQVHPDLNPNDPSNHSKFIQLNEAYNTLSKTTSRREYDMTLAHRMYYDDNLKRHGYGSHTSGSSYAPGSGTGQDAGFEGQQGAFWDETIWYMRDRSRDKDAFYPEDSYYGIKGVKRVSNGTVLLFCMGIMMLGSVCFFLCVKYSRKKSKQYIDIQERKNLALYHKARENASKYTTSEQLQRIFVEKRKIETENVDSTK